MSSKPKPQTEPCQKRDGCETRIVVFSSSGFSGAGGGLAALWLASWATSQRAASHGWTRRSSEACSGRDKTKSGTGTWTENVSEITTGSGAARRARPRWTSPPGLDWGARSWMKAAASRMVGQWLRLRWDDMSSGSRSCSLVFYHVVLSQTRQSSRRLLTKCLRHRRCSSRRRFALRSVSQRSSSHSHWVDSLKSRPPHLSTPTPAAVRRQPGTQVSNRVIIMDQLFQRKPHYRTSSMLGSRF